MRTLEKILRTFFIFIVILCIFAIISVFGQFRSKNIVIENQKGMGPPTYSIYGSTLTYDISGSGEYVSASIRDTDGNIWTTDKLTGKSYLQRFSEGEIWIGNLDFDSDIEVFTYTSDIFVFDRTSSLLSITSNGIVVDERNMIASILSWPTALVNSWFLWFLVIPIGGVMLVLYIISKFIFKNKNS